VIDDPLMKAGVWDPEVGLVSGNGLAIVQMLRESRQLVDGGYVTVMVSTSWWLTRYVLTGAQFKCFH